MGREKLLLDAGSGELLVLRQQRCLLEVGLPTFLLAAPGRATPRLAKVARLHDPEPGAGPLAAMRVAHARLGAELLVLAADQPSLAGEQLQALLGRADENPQAPAVIAGAAPVPEPFPGLYRPGFFEALDPGQRSIVDALRSFATVVDAALAPGRLRDWDTPRDRAGTEGT